MNSNELMLLLLKKVAGMDNLHFGLWNEGDEVTLENFLKAQDRYSELLIDKIEALVSANKQARILDVGCGVGTNIKLLADRGYTHIEGVVPSEILAEQAREKSGKPIHMCTFEDFLGQNPEGGYDLIFFSESYQYIDIASSFDALGKLLKPEGHAVIFDFFGVGDFSKRTPFGGHALNAFMQVLDGVNFEITEDMDLTPRFGKNATFFKDVADRAFGAAEILDIYLSERRKYLYGLIKFFFRSKAKKVVAQTENLNEAYFLENKLYKIMVLRQAS